MLCGERHHFRHGAAIPLRLRRLKKIFERLAEYGDKSCRELDSCLKWKLLTKIKYLTLTAVTFGTNLLYPHVSWYCYNNLWVIFLKNKSDTFLDFFKFMSSILKLIVHRTSRYLEVTYWESKEFTFALCEPESQ